MLSKQFTFLFSGHEILMQIKHIGIFSWYCCWKSNLCWVTVELCKVHKKWNYSGLVCYRWVTWCFYKKLTGTEKDRRIWNTGSRQSRIRMSKVFSRSGEKNRLRCMINSKLDEMEHLTRIGQLQQKIKKCHDLCIMCGHHWFPSYTYIE